MYATRGIEYEPTAALHHHYTPPSGGYSSAAGTYSREDYSQWKTHTEQFTFSEPLINHHQQEHHQIDGRGRRGKADRKTSAPTKLPPPAMTKTRRGELVGLKPPLRSAVSQPPINYRRDEMVAPMNRIYPDRTSNRANYYQQQHQQQQSTDRIINNNYHHHVSRAEQYMASKSNNILVETTAPHQDYRERKRSVSPQIERKVPLTQQPLQLTTVEGSLFAVKKTAKKHKKIRLNLELHAERVKTFEREPKWPKDRVLPTLLASYGFYYTGQEDITQCFSCNEKISDWGIRDDPLVRHFEKSPNCKHIRTQYHYDIELHCGDTFGPYIDVSVREKSFDFWPIPRQVKVKDLIRAGWFYTGKDVITQCFTCGCVYDNWRKGDDPLIKHRELSDKCSFLKQIPSIDFSSIEPRLQSFKLLPVDFPVTKEDLARAGFHLIGTQPMRVKCWSCDLVIESEWEKGDDPKRIHKLMRPSCKALSEEEEEQEDVSSFPRPIMTKREIMNKFRSRSDEMEDMSMETNLYNAPIHLPPGLKQHTKSLPVKHTHNTTTTTTTSSSFSLPEEDKLCVVCLDSPKQYAIVPCGHLCVCQSCCQQLIFCPICRMEKEDALRIFDA